MAQYIGYLSDITGKRIEGKPFQISIWTDRRMDAAGSMEDVYESFHLDPADVQTLLHRLTKKTAHQDVADAILGELRKMKQEAR